MDKDKQTDFLFRELESYKSSLNTYSFSTFEDVKYIGAVIAIILVPTLLEKLLASSLINIFLAFGFFASLNLSLLWLEQRNCLKLSIIRFLMARIKDTEQEIQTLNGGKPISLNQAVTWQAWSDEKHQPITREVMITFELILLVLPVGHLLLLGMLPILSSESNDNALLCAIAGLGSAVTYWRLHQWKTLKLKHCVSVLSSSQA